MKLSVLAVIAALSVGGGLVALQDQPPAADSHKATSSIVVNDANGDEISLTYRTVKYSQMQVDRMKESAEGRKMWAQYMPQKLQASLQLDTDLVYKAKNEYTLPAGKYSLSFGMNDNLGWEMYLFTADNKRAAKIALDIKESMVSFDYLTLNLMSAGEHDYKLAVGYGKNAAMIPFSIKATEEKNSEGQ